MLGTRSGRGRAFTDVRIHDLRHSYASRALALGESLPMIGKLLGHRRIETTARYAHLAWDSVHTSAERIAESLADDLLMVHRCGWPRPPRGRGGVERQARGEPAQAAPASP